MCACGVFMVFFFKQKTAYEMRIRDWSSDVCSSDLVLKVIDQGADDTTNAVSIRRFFTRTAGVETKTSTEQATLIQTRHRIPETPLRQGQKLGRASCRERVCQYV